MRYRATEKLEIVRTVDGSHLPTKKTLDMLGIPRTTFHRWYDRYVEGGFDSLTDRSPRPKSVWNRIPDVRRDDLIEFALTMFCEEYAKERNRLQAEATQNRGSLEKELSATKRDHSKLIDAILAGVPAEQVKDRMNALDARRVELEAQLSHEPAPSLVRSHPKMAESYRARVGLLISQLQQAEGMLEAKEALRGLIDRIVLTPDATTGRLSLDLEGALAALLLLSTGTKTQKGLSDKAQVIDYIEELVLVAGVGFEPTTFRL